LSIPDISNTGSNNRQKRGGGKFFVVLRLFLEPEILHNVKLFFFEQIKKFVPIDKELKYFYPQKCHVIKRSQIESGIRELEKM
jgi:hypothetical protein